MDAVVLATPHSLHAAQVIAAAAAGKHVFCEKPFALTKAKREAAVNAAKKRRRHARPRLQPPVSSGDDEAARRDRGPASSATILHVEATMTFPNALLLKPDAWRADPRRDPVRRTHADGRSRDRRHDRPLRSRSITSSARVSGASSRWTPTTRPRILFRMKEACRAIWAR